MYRNHQCLVFEMLSLNLYELLKNTQFGGVSLNLIRKFAKQVLKALSFLSRKDVDIIHCDLKPENILLRHPKKSGVKVIDFGSSCRSNKRMYSYIQSRFYRSPEVMLGLPYATSIDMWSLGCILAEMHTGEPLFSGSDQFDQMQKIVKLLGMLPSTMLDQASDTHRGQFFERVVGPTGLAWSIKQVNPGSTSRHPAPQQEGKSPSQPSSPVVPSQDPIGSLNEVIRAESNRKKKYPPSETGNSARNYELFVDLIYRMLVYDPRKRIKPEDALNHPFIVSSGT
jgi:dual specificity tyrosine-phosphorylation-regulated kinase 1